MNYRLFKLSRKAVCGLCLAVVSGGFFSCHDRYDLDEPGNYPSWLGESVYDQLKNPNPEVLDGTFNNYVRLIDDLGYTETLSKTGSKTVFPANDEAFERFYQNNLWGVSKYEDLTESMKKLLINASMLNNAILVEMLSNATVSDELQQGVILKHRIGGERYDSITRISKPEGMPQNNTYWEKYYDKGISLVMDATDPMMVHFTAEQMIANNITTRGDGSDFEVITGTPYNDAEKSAYIFRNKIINGDVTCKNGYIHQLEDVLVPPGNLAEVIRTNGNSNYFSRMLDRFCAPFYEGSLTSRYNDYAQGYGKAHIDSIFQMRYFSSRSQGGIPLMLDPNRVVFPNLLLYDPGWNAYTTGMGGNELSDLAAIFVPTDEAMKKYFLPGGAGSFLITQYGSLENTEANLAQNIDSIPGDKIVAFINNLMKTSFINTVPSKFGDIMDDASDPMGLSLDVINRDANGRYDVKIANNGIVYMLNTVFAPNQYVVVSSPAFMSDNMRVMNTAIQDGSTTMGSPLGYNMHYYAYLLATSANYGLFIPTDEAFGKFYVDPTYLKRSAPRALRFYYDARRSPYVFCSSWSYDPLTREVGDSIQRLSQLSFQSHLKDILNYHTVVLNDGEVMGTNRYYKTKHGGEVLFENGTVMSGGQIDEGLPVSNIEATYANLKNGTAFAIDHVIQAPQKSVYAVLYGDDRYSEFARMMDGFGADSLFEFASDRMTEINSVTKKTRRDGYRIFVDEPGHYGLDYDVKFFNSYNYTVYLPDNEAMQKAYNLGLPTWDDIAALYDKYAEEWQRISTFNEDPSPELVAARDKALAMLEEINAFVRYHFQDNSIYADNVVETGVFGTACADTLGIRDKLTVSGGGNALTVTDNRGNRIVVDANNKSKMVNQMTRDYVFNTRATAASSIMTSSFAVIHQISSPLNRHHDSDRYDGLWTGASAKKKLSAFRRLYDSRLYQQY